MSCDSTKCLSPEMKKKKDMEEEEEERLLTRAGQIQQKSRGHQGSSFCSLPSTDLGHTCG